MKKSSAPNAKKSKSTTVTKIMLSAVQSFAAYRVPSEQTITELVDSIKRVGLRHPIAVRPIPAWGPKTYELVSGRHRFEAYKRLGLVEIEATILSKREARIFQHSENLHRKDLTPLERYDALAGYCREVERSDGGRQPHDRGISATAKKGGIDRKVVRFALQAQKLSPKARAMLTKMGGKAKAVLINKVSAEQPEKQAALLTELKATKKRRGGSKPKNKAEDSTNDAAEISLDELLRQWKASGLQKLWRRADEQVKREFRNHALGVEKSRNEEW